MIAFKAALDSAWLPLRHLHQQPRPQQRVTTAARISFLPQQLIAPGPPSRSLPARAASLGVSVDPATTPAPSSSPPSTAGFPHDEDFHRSTDSGATWTSLWTSNTTFDDSTAPWASTLAPHWLDAVAIDPFNTAHAMFGTGFGLFQQHGNINTTGVGQMVLHRQRPHGEETVPPIHHRLPYRRQSPLGVAEIGDVDDFQASHLHHHRQGTRFSPNEGTNNDLEFAQLNPSDVGSSTYEAEAGLLPPDDGVTWTSPSPRAPPTISNGASATSPSPPNGSTTRLDAHRFPCLGPTPRNNGTTWTLSTGSPSSSTTQLQTRRRPLQPQRASYIYNDSSQVPYHVSSNGSVSSPAAASIFPYRLPSSCRSRNRRRPLGSQHPAASTSSVNFGTPSPKCPPSKPLTRSASEKPHTAKLYPALYFFGTIAGILGFYRSDDAGAPGPRSTTPTTTSALDRPDHRRSQRLRPRLHLHRRPWRRHRQRRQHRPHNRHRPHRTAPAAPSPPLPSSLCPRRR